MNKYTFSAHVTVSAVCEIKAATLAEAQEKLAECPVVVESGHSPNFKNQWVITEGDGEPRHIELVRSESAK